MMKSVFVAGSTGAIGRVLCQLLIGDGWRVIGTTRSEERARDLVNLGVEPAIVDVFDRGALIQALGKAQPALVVHQLTDLPKQFDPQTLSAARPGNARIRRIGTDNLIAAATAAGVQRLIAQSIAFAYAAGARPYLEESPLDTEGAAAVVTLEALVLAAPLEGIVLRYGRLYGPHTWFAEATGEAPVHVEAAADAARRALTQGAPGIYNVAEEDGVVSSRKARTELGWRADYRLR